MKYKTLSRKKSAFSLIELSIVLVIIGLLVAGVTGGASLIKSAELRGAIGEARAFAVSVNGFYNEFNYLPGDYATAIGSSSTGDGDGTIEYNSGAGGTHFEGLNAWVQMKAAGVLDTNMLSGASSITTADVTSGYSSFGVDIPASKIKSSGWGFDYNTTTYQNVVVLTAAISGSSQTDGTNTLVNSTVVSTGALTPIDALSIDAKVDDGVSNTGKVRGVGVSSSNSSSCMATGSASYYTTATAKNCAISYQIDINS